MKNSSFLVAILITFGFNNIQGGQATSRPIRRPEDLLKQAAPEDLLKQKNRDALYAASARRQQAMRKVLLEEKPELIAFFTTPGGYKIPLQQPRGATISEQQKRRAPISESSSEDNFYQADYHVPTQESSLTRDTGKVVIAHTILQPPRIVTTPPTKRDLSPVRSDEFLSSADDDEIRLDSPESEQPKRSCPDALQDMDLLNRSLTPSDQLFTNDFLDQEIIHHLLND